jgi:hypothetical protein
MQIGSFCRHGSAAFAHYTNQMADRVFRRHWSAAFAHSQFNVQIVRLGSAAFVHYTIFICRLVLFVDLGQRHLRIIHFNMQIGSFVNMVQRHLRIIQTKVEIGFLVDTGQRHWRIALHNTTCRSVFG